MLIDRRNRLEGELKKLQNLKREAEDLCKHVQTEFEAAASRLDEVAGRFDPERIRETYSVRSHGRNNYGVLTRMIVSALKAAQGRPLTQTEIAKWMEERWTGDKDYIAVYSRWHRNVNKRLGALRRERVLLSPQVGNGHTTSTTWIINPDLIISGLDTESTLFHDDDLGSSRRTTEKDRTDGSA
jgi:hypothetical protein